MYPKPCANRKTSQTHHLETVSREVSVAIGVFLLKDIILVYRVPKSCDATPVNPIFHQRRYSMYIVNHIIGS